MRRARRLIFDLIALLGLGPPTIAHRGRSGRGCADCGQAKYQAAQTRCACTLVRRALREAAGAG